MPILADEDPLDWTPIPFPLLEVLTRRYYSIRELGDMRREPGGLLRTSYARHDRTVHVLAGRVDGEFDDALGLVAAASDEVAATGHRRRRPLHGPPDRARPSMSPSWRRALGRVELPQAVRRVAVVASHPSAGAEVFTFRRPDDDGVAPVLDDGAGSRPRPGRIRRGSRRTSSSAGCTR